jgi:hypothetical protein
MAKMGRPKHKISKEEFEKLCVIQCTQEECAAWFDCDVATFHRWVKFTYGTTFAKVYAQKKGKGKVSMRRTFFQEALKGKNAALLIFWAKNHLGMSDKQETHITGETQQSRLVIEFAKDEEPEEIK